MNAPEQHGEFDQLLPLYANGSLDAATRARVARHLEQCAACREELAFLGNVRDALRHAAAKETSARAEGGFDSLPAELRARVQASAQQRQPRLWKTAALAASIVAVMALGVALTVPEEETAQFRTATVAGQGGDSMIIEVRFRADAGAQEVGRLLREHRAVVLRGPEDENRWTLEIPVNGQRNPGDVVETLRRNGDVADVRLLESDTQ